MKTEKRSERAGKELNSRTASLDAKLGTLLRSHEREAHQVAYSLAGNVEEAKELVQEASYRVVRNWERYDPLKSFGGWYVAIVRNLFLDRRRAQKQTVSMSEPVEGEWGDFAEVLAEGGLGILERLEREELAQAAHEALAALAAKYRAVVRLCDLEGLGYEEAARKLDIPLGTLRSRLFRARAALRRDPRIRRLA